MFSIFEHELDNIGSATVQSNLHLALFGVSFGAALTLGITLNTVAIPDPLTYGAYWAGFLVALVGFLYFGIRALIDWRTARREVQRIKEGSRSTDSA